MDSLANYSSSGKVISYAITINNTASPEKIPITYTDIAFYLFLLNSTDDKQLITFINSTANAILRLFPAGLITLFSIIIVNPALSGNNILIANFTNSIYHKTII
jgi:hypothetical protein